MHHGTAFGYRRAARQRMQRRELQQRANTAEAVRSAHPHNVAAAQRAQQEVQRLQQYDEQQGDTESRALGALWATYGEQGTGWFHRLGKQPPDRFPILQLRQPEGGDPVGLCTAEGALRAGSLLADYFDGEQPTGLFHPRPVSQPAQEVLLDSIDRVLSEGAARACLGPQEDGRLTEACLAKALADAPSGKSPGNDGLPYAFYRAFWEEVKGPLVAAFNEAFLSEDPQSALASLLMGLIVLIYKQGGKPRDCIDSYRPITLLNCDVKLVAKVMARRFGVPLDSVIDVTQTAFVPGRYIGDNVLYHLEALEYFPEANLPACLVGLDFSKAYDRVDRGWLRRCLEALGIPALAIRWVNLLLDGTRGMVLYNGHLSPAFEIKAGCAQGSPLSPLLYVVAAQPLASRCRQLVRQGLVSPLVLPGGTEAPPMHQHADDTTLHARSVEDAGTMLEEAVQPFCAASGAELNLPKSWGLTLGAHPLLVGPHAGTGVPFVAPGQSVRHLGVPLVVGDAGAAVAAVFAGKLQAMRFRILRWSKFKLTYLGRVHVAKQVLASTLSYHASFLAVPPEQMQQMTQLIQGYVAKERVVEQAEGTVWGRPCAAAAALPKGMGGVGMVDLPAFVQALRAKVVAMLLHPRASPWKALMRRALVVGAYTAMTCHRWPT
jgi:Reverse transcriptase (RNA-dependent DNA polymerase)